jgi:hypothetical protein
MSISYPNSTIIINTGNVEFTGSAGGDLTGSYPDPEVKGIRARNIYDGVAPVSGNALVYDGTQWVYADVSGSGGGGGTPSGPAGGILSGTYPSPEALAVAWYTTNIPLKDLRTANNQKEVTLQAEDGTSDAYANHISGTTIRIVSGQGISGSNSGDIYVQPAEGGDNTTNGGSLYLYSGNGSNELGGTSTGSAGTVYIQGGNSSYASGNAGTVDMRGGVGYGIGGIGGDIYIEAGTGSVSGKATIKSPNEIVLQSDVNTTKITLKDSTLKLTSGIGYATLNINNSYSLPVTGGAEGEVLGIVGGNATWTPTSSQSLTASYYNTAYLTNSPFVESGTLYYATFDRNAYLLAASASSGSIIDIQMPTSSYCINGSGGGNPITAPFIEFWRSDNRPVTVRLATNTGSYQFLSAVDTSKDVFNDPSAFVTSSYLELPPASVTRVVQYDLGLFMTYIKVGYNTL